MKNDKDMNRYFSGSIYRLLSGLFGLFLTAVGIYVIFFGVIDPILRLVIGLLITLLGLESIWASVQSKQSWLAKFGPFF